MITPKLIISGLLFVLTVASGFWLSSLGRPFNQIIFNVHKLIALGAVVYTALIIREAMKGLSSNIYLPLLTIATALMVLALFITGALISSGNSQYSLLVAAHNGSTIGAILTTATLLFFLARVQS